MGSVHTPPNLRANVPPVGAPEKPTDTTCCSAISGALYVFTCAFLPSCRVSTCTVAPMGSSPASSNAISGTSPTSALNVTRYSASVVLDAMLTVRSPPKDGSASSAASRASALVSQASESVASAPSAMTSRKWPAWPVPMPDRCTTWTSCCRAMNTATVWCPGATVGVNLNSCSASDTYDTSAHTASMPSVANVCTAKPVTRSSSSRNATAEYSARAWLSSRSLPKRSLVCTQNVDTSPAWPSTRPRPNAVVTAALATAGST